MNDYKNGLFDAITTIMLVAFLVARIMIAIKLEKTWQIPFVIISTIIVLVSAYFMGWRHASK